MTAFDPVQRTRTLARVAGPYLAVMSSALLVRAEAIAPMLPAFMHDAPLTFAAGAFTLFIGLAALAAHHHWSSPAAIVVSLIGLAAALKGAMLMLAPDFGMDITMQVAAPGVLRIVAAPLLVVGLWLSFVGWVARGGKAA